MGEDYGHGILHRDQLGSKSCGLAAKNVQACYTIILTAKIPEKLQNP